MVDGTFTYQDGGTNSNNTVIIRGEERREQLEDCVPPSAGPASVRWTRRRLVQALIVRYQLLCNPIGHIGAGAPEFRAVAFLSGGPDHVAILVDQAHGSQCLMGPLLDVARFVFTDTEAQSAAAVVVVTGRSPVITGAVPDPELLFVDPRMLIPSEEEKASVKIRSSAAPCMITSARS